MTEHVKVFIVDDHELVREGLRLMLSRLRWHRGRGFRSKRRRGLAQVEAIDPDVMLLDMRLTGIHGLDVIVSLARAASYGPVCWCLLRMTTKTWS